VINLQLPKKKQMVAAGWRHLSANKTVSQPARLETKGQGCPKQKVLRPRVQNEGWRSKVAGLRLPKRQMAAAGQRRFSADLKQNGVEISEGNKNSGGK